MGVGFFNLQHRWGFVLFATIGGFTGSLSPPLRRDFVYVVATGVALQVVGMLLRLRVVFVLGMAVSLLGGIYCLGELAGRLAKRCRTHRS